MTIQRDFIGPFQLIRLIRSGTTTQVWEAKQEGERERVALKILLREFRENQEEIEHLKHEAKVGSVMDHANVIKIFGYHNFHGYPFISMQLFNAKNLKIEMREKPEFVTMNMKEIIEKCACGLQHMHEKGWVHCDVKPDNFLADEQPNVKLIDFSIAEKIKKGLFAPKPKTIRGTRSYMAPEQIRKKKVDARTDIYGFGCVLFELLAGRAPYTASNPDVLLTRHLNAPIPSLESISGASRDLNKLVMQMIAKKPEDRLQSMQDFLLQFRSMQVYRPGHRPKFDRKTEPEET